MSEKDIQKDKKWKEDPFYFGEASAFLPEKEDPFERRKKELIKEYNLDGFDISRIESYLKVGIFCFMSPEEFERTDQWKIEYIDIEIDRRFKSNDFGIKAEKPQLSVDGKYPEPINYTHSALILALARLFAGDDKNKSSTRSK